MKKIFITGASSLLGETLTHALESSYEITILEHNKVLRTFGRKSVKIIHGSLENISDWESELSDISTVIHLAAITHSKNTNLYKTINATGTKDLIEASKRQGVKQFIYISTRAIGTCCGAYGESKELAERYLKDSGLPYTILRVGEVYDREFGAKEGLGSIASLIDKSPIIPYLAEKNITLAPIHKNDVRDAVVAVIDNSKTLFKTYVICGPENISFRDIVSCICKHKKAKRFLLPIPLFIARLGFFFISRVLHKAAPDQLQRLVCTKESLSRNVLDDLNIKPERFLN